MLEQTSAAKENCMEKITAQDVEFYRIPTMYWLFGDPVQSLFV